MYFACVLKVRIFPWIKDDEIQSSLSCSIMQSHLSPMGNLFRSSHLALACTTQALWARTTCTRTVAAPTLSPDKFAQLKDDHSSTSASLPSTRMTSSSRSLTSAECSRWRQRVLGLVLFAADVSLKKLLVKMWQWTGEVKCLVILRHQFCFYMLYNCLCMTYGITGTGNFQINAGAHNIV